MTFTTAIRRKSMQAESKKSMNQLKEMIRKDDETKRFIRCRQGVELYNMSRPQFGLFLEKILAMDI